MSTYDVIGKSTVRTDGPDKVTGRAEYAIDVTPPDTLWCKFLRSPYAHARVVQIDASEALKLPGVHAVLTGEEVRDVRGGNIMVDEPLLSSWDRVRFIGDKVAAVVAEDEDAAQRALDLIDVKYEELPAVFDPEEAAQPNAPILHPDFNTYRNVKPQETPSNVYHHAHHEEGDVERGFAEADVVVEGTYRTERVHQAYLEPHACLVLVDERGRLQAWASNQAPTARRVHLARMVDLPREDVILNPVHLGGSYGGKLDVTGVAVCYFLSKKTGRPVKFVMDYAEELMAMNPRHPSVFHIKAGVKRDGTITAWHVSSSFASGAYAAYAPSPPFGEMSGKAMMEPYDVANVRVESDQVYTNTVPAGYFRAPGSTQAIFASESHIDVVARAIEMSPYELRKRNIVRGRRAVGASEPESSEEQEIRLEETMEVAASEAGLLDNRSFNVGRGMVITEHGQIGFEGHAAVHIHPDGRIVANMSTFDPGMGTATFLAQVVSEELKVPPGRIEVVPWSTETGPRDQGVGGSRGARVTTIAGYEAAQDVKGKLVRLGAELYGWAEERIAFEDGNLINEATDERVPLEEIAARTGEPVSGQGDIDEGMKTAFTSYATHVAEVSVDPETGEVRLLKYTSVQETGTVLNPAGFTGQIEGGVMQGIGQAMMEEISIEDGRVTNPSLADYKIPSEKDVPELRSIVLESTVGHGPYNVRGIGEGAITMPSAAIANAVEDASGVRIADLPVTAEKVYRALREKGG